MFPKNILYKSCHIPKNGHEQFVITRKTIFLGYDKVLMYRKRHFSIHDQVLIYRK